MRMCREKKNNLYATESFIEFPWEEIAFDAVGIADAELDVIFFAEAGIGI